MIGRNWQRFWRQDCGFTLIEVVAATFIAGTVVVGSMLLLGNSARTSSSTFHTQDLQHLVETQIETIKTLPFDPGGDYPLLADVPEEVSLTVSVSDAGTRYTYPEPDGVALTNVVQSIVVEANNGTDEVVMRFYKTRSP